jgi:hypothetical protein
VRTIELRERLLPEQQLPDEQQLALRHGRRRLHHVPERHDVRQWFVRLQRDELPEWLLPEQHVPDEQQPALRNEWRRVRHLHDRHDVRQRLVRLQRDELPNRLLSEWGLPAWHHCPSLRRGRGHMLYLQWADELLLPRRERATVAVQAAARRRVLEPQPVLQQLQRRRLHVVAPGRRC